MEKLAYARTNVNYLEARIMSENYKTWNNYEI
jgi:hypothetical protein